LPVSETQNLRNNTQPFQPLYTSMLAVQYGFGKKDWKGFVRGEWRALGRQYFDFENVSLQDPYSLFNAKAGLNYKNYGLELWVRNLTGERYIQFGYAQLGFANFLLGAPRTFGATVSARF
jgi:iron complex outermembrane receptor protein